MIREHRLRGEPVALRDTLRDGGRRGELEGLQLAAPPPAPRPRGHGGLMMMSRINGGGADKASCAS